jgi:hypothetical protein
MSTRMKRIILVASVLVALACVLAAIGVVHPAYKATRFEDAYARVEPGMSRTEVEALLGAPEEVQEIRIPEDGHFWGPQESLTTMLGPGAPFEQWTYQRGDYSYCVCFASPAGEPKENWLVIFKAQWDTNAVF